MAEPNQLRAWNPKSGTTEPMAPADLERRFRAGEVQLVSEDTYPMANGDVAQGGDVRLVPAAKVNEALAHGYRFAEHAEVTRAEARNDPAGAYKAFGDGLVNQAMLGFGDAARVSAGADPDAIQARAAEHGTARAFGGVTGAVSGTIALGALAPGALAERAAATALGGGAESMLGRVAVGAAGNAMEGAVRGIGDVVSEAALGRTDVTAEALLAHGGAGALLGAGIGGAFGALRGLRPRVRDAKALYEGATGEAWSPSERAAMERTLPPIRKISDLTPESPGATAPGFRPPVNPHAETVTAPGVVAAVDEMAAKAVARRAALGGLMGGAVGGMVGHPVLGAEVGAMLGGANPGGQLMRAARAVSAVREYIDEGVERFITSPGIRATGALASRTLTPATAAVLSATSTQARAEAHAERMAELGQLSADPTLHADRVAAHLEPLRGALPDTMTVVSIRATSALQLLASAAPQPLVQPNPLSPGPVAGNVPDSEIKRFAEVDAAVQDPLRIVDQLAAGRVPEPAAVAAVQQLYPAYWHMVEQSFMLRLAQANGRLSQRARVQASIAFGVVTHPSLDPQAISVSQSVSVEPPPQPRAGRARRSTAASRLEDPLTAPTKLDKLLAK